MAKRSTIKDLFGKPIPQRRPRNEAALERAEKATLPVRAARVRWISQVIPKNTNFGMPIDTFYVFEEAKSSFVYGNFVAAVVLAAAFVELEPLVSGELTVPVGREYWLKKNKKTVEVAEAVIKILQKFDASISPNFRRGFIGIHVGNTPVLNFVSFGPFTGQVKFRIKVENPAPWREKLKKAGLQVLQPDRTDNNKVRLAVTREDISRNEPMLRRLCKDGYDFWSK